MLLWNPQAISYLSELILLIGAAALFLQMVFDERRKGRTSAVSLMLCLLLCSFAATVSLMMARSGLPLAQSHFVLPWIAPVGSIALIALVQFAYRFPHRLGLHWAESRFVFGLLVAMTLAELAVALWRDHSLRYDGMVWFRPSQMDGWLVAGLVWLVLLFLRQLAASVPQKGLGWKATAKQIFARGGGTDLKAARAFLVFALLPLVHVVSLLLRSNGWLGIFAAEVLVCWITLVQTAGFVLIYLNYMAERSSFMVKLLGICVTTILAAVSGISWLINPVITQAYPPNSRPQAGQALRFTPDGRGGYHASQLAYAPVALSTAVEVGRDPVKLPFRFPFYGQSYNVLFPRENGTLAFDHSPTWPETSLKYGAQPAIFPLVADLERNRYDQGGKGGGVQAQVAQDRVTLFWHDLTEIDAPQQRYDFQATLYADGRIDFVYVQIPTKFEYSLVLVNKTIWFLGITPGQLGHRIRQVDLASGASVQGGPSEGLIQDFHAEFQAYLDRFYAPIAGFLVFVVGLMALVLPAFFRINLVEPLGELMAAVVRFRRGEMTARADRRFNDEIGYLAGAFNAMAADQHELVHQLEEKVAERSAQASAYAADNARLEERNRLSGDLHDTVSQTLFSAAMLADSIPQQWQRDPAAGEAALDKVIRLNRHALLEMRQLLLDLTVKGLADRPLSESLREMVDGFAADHGIGISIDAVSNGNLPTDVRAMIYRIAQECLNNIAKHAKASHVSLTFDALPEQALLVIADDGCGFDPDKVGGGHLGLQIMQDRAERIGAKIEWVSAAGKGTTMTLMWFGNDAD